MEPLAVAALVVIGVGALLILAGLFVSITDWHDKRKARTREHPGAETKPLGLPETIDSLGQLVEVLAKHPMGIRLIVLGIVCVLVGGSLGGASALTA
jgi:predicted RND superfamily exporter protein